MPGSPFKSVADLKQAIRREWVKTKTADWPMANRDRWKAFQQKSWAAAAEPAWVRRAAPELSNATPIPL